MDAQLIWLKLCDQQRQKENPGFLKQQRQICLLEEFDSYLHVVSICCH